MRIVLLHGYELVGSGSNEYTRYLGRWLAAAGHDVVIVCADPEPDRIPFVNRVVSVDGSAPPLERAVEGPAIAVYRLPTPRILPVYVTDKERPGSVAAFTDLTDAQLEAYHLHMCTAVRAALEDVRPDVVHVNHTVWMACVAAEVCPPLQIPYYIVPHGSAIEYTVKRDVRYERAAADALSRAAGLVFISAEIRDRVRALFPGAAERLTASSHLVGVGTDTSTFRPLSAVERQRARTELALRHRPGGRPASTRADIADLARADDLGRAAQAMHAARAGWDHQVEDADFPERVLAIPTDGELIAFVGSLTWGKGVQSVIAAMPRLLAQRPDAHLLVVGSGRFREALEALVVALDEGREATLRTLVDGGRALEQPDLVGALDDVGVYLATERGRAEVTAALGSVAERVHFVGRLDHARLALLLPCARVAAFPSIVKEASPLVFAEALAAGVVPAASDHSGFHDGLADLEDELPPDLWGPMHLPTEPAERIAGIADRLATLLARTSDPALPGRLAEIARRKHDWAGVATRLAEAATSIADAANSRSSIAGQ